MSEACTFSALIDDAIARSQRKDRVNDIVSYARSTIRECQALAFFDQDLIEDSLTVDVLPFQWSRPLNLRSILAAKPAEVFDRRSKKVWFKRLKPGKQTRDEDYFLYLSGNTFIFSGEALAVGDVINVAYFTYARKFVYYDTASRPATFDPETETWTYLASYDTSDANREIAVDLVQNWLLKYWFDLLLEGVLAKLYKTVGDERSKTAYSLYKSQQEDLLSGERVIYLRDTEHAANR